MKYLMVILILTLAACGEKSSDLCQQFTPVSKTIDPAKKNLLVIGDSISINWAPYAAKQLSQYNVYHTYCNSESSSNGMRYIAYWVQGNTGPYDFIVFNFGDWDMPGNEQSVDVNQYTENMQALGSIIKTHSGGVLFLTEPMVSADFAPIQLGPNTFAMTNTVVDQYNQAATTVMNGLNIPVLDLYSTSLPLYQQNAYDSSKLHFTQAGDSFLANAIVTQLNTMGVN